MGSRKVGAWRRPTVYQDLRQQTRKLLTHFPLAQPLAPESEEVKGKIRHLIFGRYRILFEIIGDTVRVLHVRGAFIDNENIDLGVDE